MPAQTRQTIIHFTAPFVLTGLEGVQPAGDYAVEEDSDEIQGPSWVAYRRVATFMQLPALTSGIKLRETVAIDHLELQAALLRDQAKDGSHQA
ncbi:hypothetical protein [Fodinicurvata fenggangensis]|uniref:hypothetical protein n=1 Tax=Fodinicurvata fenggangensis TaxID=1121830 RepID=UPI00047E441D|nr:hypothetical protein [Fodinicurvata fenggangensis]